MLNLQGIDSDVLKDNSIHLGFSLTDKRESSMVNKGGTNSSKLKDIYFSSTLITSDGLRGSADENKQLYEIIINRLKSNSSLIKEGGFLDIYYVVPDKLEDVAGSYKVKNDKLIPSITEHITLNNGKDKSYNQLTVRIYIFDFESFFREYLPSAKVFSSTYFTREDNKKL